MVQKDIVRCDETTQASKPEPLDVVLQSLDIYFEYSLMFRIFNLNNTIRKNTLHHIWTSPLGPQLPRVDLHTGIVKMYPLI